MNRREFSFFVLLFSFLNVIHSQDQQNFINLSVNDGLSQSTIFSIYQDSNGFMWFGTRGGGLNRYNGYDFQIFRNQADMEGSLSDNTVRTILEDSRGILWIGTGTGGINRFDINTGRFSHYLLEDRSNVYPDVQSAVKCIYEDRKGTVWVGTNHNVVRYDRNEDRFVPVMTDAHIPVKITTSICEDREGYLYFATWDRLIRYHPEKNTYSELNYEADPFADMGGRINPVMIDRNNRLWLGVHGGLKMVDLNEGFFFNTDEVEAIGLPASFNYVRAIEETRDGMLWFGTQNGLYSYSYETGVLKEFRTNPGNPSSLSHNSIYSIFEDKVGTLWIGTWSGLSKLDKRKYNFRHYTHHYKDPASLSNNIVSSFQEGQNGTWIGTEQGGLNFMNSERTEFISYKYDPNDPESLPNNNVKSVFLDSNSDLWVGTFNGALSLYLGNGRFQHFLKGHSIYSITEFPRGTLYIGGRGGLFKMDLESKNITNEIFPISSGKTRIDIFVTELYTDSRERIWIATRNEGVYLFDPSRSILRQFRNIQYDSSSICSDDVISIHEDLQQNIWIGTYSGLNRFNESDYSFERVNQKFGIKDYIINGLQSDDEGRLWISTNTGIYSYDSRNDELRHFDFLDGLQSNEFNRGACYKNSAGELFYGGVKGFNVFHPYEIKKNPDAPPIVITDLKLFNESVVPKPKNSPLTKHISETKEISLSHSQSSFSFDFVALNYLIPEKNSYAYILEGYEDEWNEAGRSRTASYMNLEPGKYTFRVMGSNNDGIWNEAGASIEIEVKAPLWATPVAILIYSIIITGLLIALIRIVRFRIEKENELLLERAEKARIKEMNVNRLQFFTNISHEFRTPLTLIAGPLDKMMSGNYKHQSEYLLQLMKSNVNRMLRLVNQLMDFRKLEHDKMPLRVQQKNMDKFLSQIVLGFDDMANRKMIELRYIADNNESNGSTQWFDVGILDKVVYNLLSNAFKFTPEEGIIEVRLYLEGAMARLEVRDTGKGVEQSKVNRIFERFYSDSPDLHSSTGIGLSLSKRLIDLHKGSISVESEVGKGANFIVTLPVSRESYSSEEIFIDTEEVFILDRPELDSLPSSVSLEEAYGEPTRREQVILIVEDNPEMSSYLANHLSEYKLLLAENGRSAFELAREHIPDIIISDVMMPEMNGIEFCKATRKEYLTSHIPIILLSAKAAVDEKIEGIDDAGADVYIEKPFDPEYLSAVVRNLLVQRKKLREKFSGLIAGANTDEGAVGDDELFLQKINQIVMDHIADPSFNVDQLLVEIGMSRSQLYRKFKAISDKNPSEYIRILRLQYACNLLIKNGHTISEIAYMSGFGNVSYFNTCFKRHYGVSPGKYDPAKT